MMQLSKLPFPSLPGNMLILCVSVTTKPCDKPKN